MAALVTLPLRRPSCVPRACGACAAPAPEADEAEAEAAEAAPKPRKRRTLAARSSDVEAAE